MEVREPSARCLSTWQRTDLGEFPIDWPLKRLDQISGGVSVGLVINPSSYFSPAGSVPMLLGSQVGPNHIDHERAKRISEESNASIPASILRAGDLITVRVGEPGITAVVPPALDGCNCASVMIVRRKSSLNSVWLCYLMNSRLGMSQVENVQYGTAQKQFNIGDAVGFRFPLPTRREQDAIARVLIEADTLIDSLEQLLTKQRQIKQGAMQELLTGKRRLPGFSGGWATKSLSDLGTFHKGAGVRRDQAASGNLPCVRYGEIYTAHQDHVRAFHSWISPEVAATATRLQQGDLLFAGSGETKEEIGKCVAFLDDCEAYAGGDIVILRPTSKLSAAFMGYALNSPLVIRQKASRGQGDAVVHISSAALGSVSLPLPEAAEQHAIAQVLTDMDASLTALQARLTKARQLKQALMQVLLTGRIRLVAPGAAAASTSPA